MCWILKDLNSDILTPCCLGRDVESTTPHDVNILLSFSLTFFLRAYEKALSQVNSVEAVFNIIVRYSRENSRHNFGF